MQKMQQLTENRIKKSFVNASRREVEKMKLPASLTEVEWAEREYLGWTDPKIPQRGCVVVPVDGAPVESSCVRPPRRRAGP